MAQLHYSAVLDQPCVIASNILVGVLRCEWRTLKLSAVNDTTSCTTDYTNGLLSCSVITGYMLKSGVHTQPWLVKWGNKGSGLKQATQHYSSQPETEGVFQLITEEREGEGELSLPW